MPLPEGLLLIRCDSRIKRKVEFAGEIPSVEWNTATKLGGKNVAKDAFTYVTDSWS
jgi:hypothetical protein